MGDSTKHALFSPSAAVKWMTCPGSIAMEDDFPSTTSDAADEGTAAHELAAWCLERDLDTKDYPHAAITVGNRAYVVRGEMEEKVQAYLDHVRHVAEGHTLLVEQRLSIQHITGETDAEGTSDAVILTADGSEIIIIDLKYGANPKNKVVAFENSQLRIYGGGALEQYGAISQPEKMRYIIVQPRLDHIDEWDEPVASLQEFLQEVSKCARLATTARAYKTNWMGKSTTYLEPSEKGCKWCRAFSACPAAQAKAEELVEADFVQMASQVDPPLPPAERLATVAPSELALKGYAMDYLEAYIKAVRSEIERRLLAGEKVDDGDGHWWKLVKGRQGARQWSDETAAEETMKAFRLKQDVMYSQKLITPTQAEKALKDQPKRWNKLQTFITRSEGSISVARGDDPREPYSASEEVEFAPAEDPTPEEDVSASILG